MQHIYHENILAAVNSAENLKTETCHKKNKFPIRTNAHISCEVASDFSPSSITLDQN